MKAFGLLPWSVGVHASDVDLCVGASKEQLQSQCTWAEFDALGPYRLILISLRSYLEGHNILTYRVDEVSNSKACYVCERDLHAEAGCIGSLMSALRALLLACRLRE